MNGSSSGAPPPAPRNPLLLRLITLILLLAVAGSSALYIEHNGLAVFEWDDSQYLMLALDTYSHVTQFGWIMWPAYIATQQHYGKPPLYINLLAGAMAVTGSRRAPEAAALVAAFSTLVLGLVVYGFAGSLAGKWNALLATIAILGMPAVVQWDSMAYPDVQLAVLVVAVFWLLSIQMAWPARGTLLGIVFGLGMLSKATFPSFVGFPLLYWLWRGNGPRASRFAALAMAGIVGTAVAGIWYATNLRGAIGYVRFSYELNVAPGPSGLGRLWAWLPAFTRDGIGYCLLGLFVIVVVAVALPGRRRSSPPPGELPVGNFVLLAVLGGVPSIMLSVMSPVAPNSRHPLPALILFGLALVFWIIRVLERWPSRTLRIAVWAAVAAQCLLASICKLPAIAELTYFSPTVRRFTPVFKAGTWNRVEDVITLAQQAPWNVPRTWYVLGNDGDLNVDRLQLSAKVYTLPQRFEWTCHYIWRMEQCREQLQQLRKTPALVVVYSRRWEELGPDWVIANRYSQLAESILDDPRNEFRKIATLQRSGYALTLYQSGPPIDSADRTWLTAR